MNTPVSLRNLKVEAFTAANPAALATAINTFLAALPTGNNRQVLALEFPATASPTAYLVYTE